MDKYKNMTHLIVIIMNNDSADLKIPYIISIFAAILGLEWYLILDIFSLGKSTLYIQILDRIVIELLIFWALLLILIIFLLYLFLEGLRFTDNDYLQKLSTNANKIYTLGFELGLIIIPFAVFLITYYLFDNIIYRIFLIITILLFFYKFILPLKMTYDKIYVIAIYLITFILIFGMFQLATSDVNINFNKDYYQTSDYVIITLSKSGISSPDIKEIKINGNSVTSEYLFTSNEGTKEVVIYNIDDIQESLVFRNNYNIVQVDIFYSIQFLFWNIDYSKFASFIVLE